MSTEDLSQRISKLSHIPEFFASDFAWISQIDPINPEVFDDNTSVSELLHRDTSARVQFEKTVKRMRIKSGSEEEIIMVVLNALSPLQYPRVRGRLLLEQRDMNLGDIRKLTTDDVKKIDGYDQRDFEGRRNLEIVKRLFELPNFVES